jgi:hypothetical protein
MKNQDQQVKPNIIHLHFSVVSKEHKQPNFQCHCEAALSPWQSPPYQQPIQPTEHKQSLAKNIHPIAKINGSTQTSSICIYLRLSADFFIAFICG